MVEEVAIAPHAKVVRLELPVAMSQTMRDFIIAGMEVNPQDVYACDGPIDMDDLFAIANLDLSQAQNEPWVPLTPRGSPKMISISSRSSEAAICSCIIHTNPSPEA